MWTVVMSLTSCGLWAKCINFSHHLTTASTCNSAGYSKPRHTILFGMKKEWWPNKKLRSLSPKNIGIEMWNQQELESLCTTEIGIQICKIPTVPNPVFEKHKLWCSPNNTNTAISLTTITGDVCYKQRYRTFQKDWVDRSIVDAKK